MDLLIYPPWQESKKGGDGGAEGMENVISHVISGV